MVCGRECDRLTKGMCVKHYSQYRRHGKILENTKYEPNKIVEYEDHAEIILYNIASFFLKLSNYKSYFVIM